MSYFSHCIIPLLFRNDTCLEREEDGKGYGGLDHTQGGLPGQRYTADEQCALALGTSYRATPSKRVSFLSNILSKSSLFPHFMFVLIIDI